MAGFRWDHFPCDVRLDDGATLSQCRVVITTDGHAAIVSEGGTLLHELTGATWARVSSGWTIATADMSWAITAGRGCGCGGRGTASRRRARQLLMSQQQ